jgi:hypothetical protein
MAIAVNVEPDAAPRPQRWWTWSHPSQRVLLLLGIGVVVGSFMPWVETPIGVYRGFAGAGRYLFYFGMIGFSAGMVPVRWAAVAQALIMAAAAVAIPLWQVLHLYSLVGFEGWTPGIGLIMVAGCGMFTARIAYRLIRS